MSSEPLLTVEDLGKCYRIRHRSTEHITLAEQLLARVRHPLRRSPTEEFWAIRHLGFEIAEGELVGLIGRNGAGKSTLLKLLTRITPPTEGRARIRGRVGSLLEVGTGFHAELTGRENIFLSGSVLGMARQEITAQFDAIVEFAGIEKFLDTPVKRYSSGMYVRLAFAVAAHLRCELMLVDEVLAVGDADFQKMCLGKIDEVTHDGRTVILVSHNLEMIARNCARTLVLRNGTVAYDGDPHRAVEHYLTINHDTDDDRRRWGTGQMRVRNVVVSQEFFRPEEPKRLRVEVEARERVDGDVFVVVALRDAEGRMVTHCDSRLHDVSTEARDFACEFELRSPWLRPGRYSVEVFVALPNQLLDGDVQAAWLDVGAGTEYFRGDLGMINTECATVPEFDVKIAEYQRPDDPIRPTLSLPQGAPAPSAAPVMPSAQGSPWPPPDPVPLRQRR